MKLWLSPKGSRLRAAALVDTFAQVTSMNWRGLLLKRQISIYHAQIGSVEPFPERADDCDTVKHAWLEVCMGRNLQVELEENI